MCFCFVLGLLRFVLLNLQTTKLWLLTVQIPVGSQRCISRCHQPILPKTQHLSSEVHFALPPSHLAQNPTLIIRGAFRAATSPSCPKPNTYHWRELPQVSFLSRQAYFCGNKRRVCFNKHLFVATKTCMSRQKWYLWQLPPLINTDGMTLWQRTEAQNQSNTELLNTPADSKTVTIQQCTRLPLPRWESGIQSER